MSSQEPVAPAGTVFCRVCGKPIEADARFCRFCGKAQVDRPAASGPTATASRNVRQPRRPAGDGVERYLSQLFPRHYRQDEFMHIGSIAAFLMAGIGFVLGFFFNYSWLGTNFLLGSIALMLFLMLRESTLGHIGGRDSDSASAGPATRYQASRQGIGPELPAEAATTQSSPPSGGRPPATPR